LPGAVVERAYEKEVKGKSRKWRTKMLVKNWMSKKVVTAHVNDTMQDAVKLLRKHGIRMLPVLEQGELVGIVTDRDMKRASASDATTLDVYELIHLISTIKLKHIMTKNPITVPFDFTVEETAEVLLKNKISGVPVVNHDSKIVGTITQTDLFKVLISLSGARTKGMQFAFEAEDYPGSIKELADILRQYGGRVASILSSYDNVTAGYRKIYIHLYGIDRSRLPELKSELRKTATLLYLVDHRENLRELFYNRKSHGYLQSGKNVSCKIGCGGRSQRKERKYRLCHYAKFDPWRVSRKNLPG
jgi:acetoin utilization protein AcuB